MKKWCKLFISTSMLIGRTRRIRIRVPCVYCMCVMRTNSKYEFAAGASTLPFCPVPAIEREKKKGKRIIIKISRRCRRLEAAVLLYVCHRMRAPLLNPQCGHTYYRLRSTLYGKYIFYYYYYY